MVDEMDEEKAVHEALKKIVQDLKDGNAKIDVVKLDMSGEMLEKLQEAKEELESLQMKMPKNEMQAMEWAETFIEDTYMQLATSGLDKLRCIGILETIKFKMQCPSVEFKSSKKKDDGDSKRKKKLVSKPA